MNETTEQTVAGVLPCPFCGSTEGFYVEEGCTFRWRVISCRSCGEGTEVRHKNNSDEPESYIADWNAAAPYPAMLRKEIETLRAQLAEPIDMVLHCPACGMQHIDAVEELPMPMPGSSFEGSAGWTNPPHRSHLCHGCGHIWRPADVPTNGVEAVKTCGKADSKLAAPTDTLRAQLAEAQAALKTVMRNAELSKEPCDPDPESPAAIRNGKFAGLAIIAAQGLGMVRGPSLTEQLAEAQKDEQRLDWIIEHRARGPIRHSSRK